MKTNTEIREWATERIAALDRLIHEKDELIQELLRHTNQGTVQLVDAQRARHELFIRRSDLSDLLNFIGEPSELPTRQFHMGGFWGDEYYDQDGIVSWMANPNRKEQDGD